MELGPIFRALNHGKARFWLVTLEVALTLAIVVNCVNVVLDLRGQYVRESGIDEERFLAVRLQPFGAAYADEAFLRELQRRDLEALRAAPGIAAAAALQSIPLSGGGSMTGRKAQGSELRGEGIPYYVVSEGIVETLGVELVAGRDFLPADFVGEEALDRRQRIDLEPGEVDAHNVIVTQAVADLLFPDGDALGKVMQNEDGEEQDTIVGIVRQAPNSWPGWREGRDRVMYQPGWPATERQMRYLVRAEPGAVEAVYGALETLLLGVDAERIVKVQTLTEIKRETFGGELAAATMLSAIIGLLLFVTSLGIVGLTAFSVTQRTRQIGTRRALGATRGDILRHFLLENWLITSFGLALGVVLSIGLNYFLTQWTEAPKMDWTLLAGGMLLLWASGLLAALAPAWRATQVAPEVATRTV